MVILIALLLHCSKPLNLNVKLNKAEEPYNLGYNFLNFFGHPAVITH